MRVIIDAMGGDRAPLEILKGASQAAAENIAEITLVGDEEKIKQIAEENSVDISRCTVVHAPSVITMEDDPVAVLKTKKDSSMLTGMRLLAQGEGDAFVSAGNTGALFMGATFTVKKAQHITRAAIATVLPGVKPCLLLDSGANLTVSEEHLEEFAIMGSAYMKQVCGVNDPTVGLLNNGTEECKGTPLQIDANHRLAACKAINYVGNVEANSALLGACDVLVTDGFTGNIMLKTVEGAGKLLFGALRGVFEKGLSTKLSYLPLKKHLREMKDTFDPSAYGGAPILGISKPVLKSHGSSDARAIKNAVAQAVKFAQSGAIDAMSAAVAQSGEAEPIAEHN